MAKLTTTQAAKLLKIHPDTLRKRAKAGKVPYTLNVLGHMQFDDTAPPFVVKTQRTKVLFVIDRSGSMGGLENKMRDAINDQLTTFKLSTDEYQISSMLFDDKIDSPTVFMLVQNYAAPAFRARGGTYLNAALTAAYDFVGQDLAYDRESSYLIVLITDGGETAHYPSVESVAARSRTLIGTDRVTVVGNGPHGSRPYLQRMGIPDGNIREWETTEYGVTQYAKAATFSNTTFASARSAGITSSTAYYANVTGAPDVVASQLSVKLEDVTKNVDTQRVVKGQGGVAVRNFANKFFTGGFEKGAIFYQLSKKEKVQSYKQIIVQDTKTGKFYRGWDSARKLLGLPNFNNGEIKVSPGNLSEFTVYVQSTSVNRKLVEGTTVLKVA